MATQFGKYQLLRKIASGGMAQIHLAKQRGLEGFEKIVVIKKILPHLASNEDFVQMFLDEARLAAKLNHPNIVQIFDLGRFGEDFFIAMEYVQGENLRSMAKACHHKQVHIPLAQAVKIVSKACQGLHYAHSMSDHQGQPMGVVHRDVSPQNILVSFDGMVKLVDFGIAKAAKQYQETRVGVLKGKFSYMSPEQCKGEVIDARSDVFSMGIVLWEMVTGSRLFGHASELIILKEITKGTVTPPRQVNHLVPVDLENIILKALKRSTSERFQDALSLHLALERFLSEHNLVASSVSLASFMQDLFREKRHWLRKIEQAQANGESLESFLFDDIQLGSDPETDPALPTEAESSTDPSAASGPSLPNTNSGLSRLSGLSGLQSNLAGVPPVPKRRSIWPWMMLVVLGCLAIGVFVGLRIFSIQDIQPKKSLRLGKVGVQSREAGGIVVHSRPPGGKVRIDGNLQCRTPCSVNQLRLGKLHTLAVSKPAYQTWTTQFRLEASDEPRRFSAVLERPGGHGTIEINTKPRGARVTLDGRRLSGKTPLRLENISAGDLHTVLAVLPNRPKWSTSFQLKPNEHLILEGELSWPAGAKKPKRISYQLRSSPPGAKFFVDGEPVPARVAKLSPARTYRVSAKLKGYQEWTETLQPGIQKPYRILATLRKIIRKSIKTQRQVPARLSLNANPWASVFIDSKRVGTTPLVDYRVASGKHHIRLINDELQASKSFAVVLAPGQVVRKTVTFQKGKLRVLAKPWANVFIGGQKIGTTPIGSRLLYEGTYTVVLRNPTLRDVIFRTVAIEAGKRVTIDVDFRK